MTYPKVYIILLNYNNWADTIECLESVLRNDYPNYQVIVVDNNSPNNSMEYLKAWAEGRIDVWVNPNNPLRNLSFPPVPKPIPYVYYTREEAEKCKNLDLEEKFKSDIPEGVTTKYPIVFIQSGNNLGFAGGNNVGIRYALIKNDFDSVILLNNDTVIKGEAISIYYDDFYKDKFIASIHNLSLSSLHFKCRNFKMGIRYLMKAFKEDLKYMEYHLRNAFLYKLTIKFQRDLQNDSSYNSIFL